MTSLPQAQVKLNGFEISSIISGLPARNIPFSDEGVPGFRIADVAVYDKDPRIFYVASSNGGVLKTVSGGLKTEFIFDGIGSCSIGALAVSQKNPNVLWVGTGDRWQRNSVGMGDGIYKTKDGGKSWQCMGLKNSISIGKISIDPNNDDVVMVAVLGSPWGYGPDRGIYKTSNGGKTWRKVLYANERSGGTDIQIDPKNPKNMLAALWDHIHHPYGYDFGGTGSAIYRSSDGGEHWNRVKGLPKGKIGKIHIGFFSKNPTFAAAVVEVEDTANSGFYRSWDGGQTWKMIRGSKYATANTAIKLWDRHFYDSYAVHFDPNDYNRIYFGSINRYTTDGKIIKGFEYDGHGCWIDPYNSKHGLVWGDNFLEESWHVGEYDLDAVNIYNEIRRQRILIQLPTLFQTYGCGYDMRKLYRVTGQAQDADIAILAPTQSFNGFVCGSDCKNISGDENGRCMADPNDWTIVYSQTRQGLNRTDLKTGITTKLDWWTGLNDIKGVRVDWYGKFEFSHWSSNTLYYATNHLLKSADGAKHWEMISPDLTHNDSNIVNLKKTMKESAGSMGTGGDDYEAISTISESTISQGTIWVGTNDGYIQLTKDGGKSWSNVTPNIPDLPVYSWCSCVEASKFIKGRAYVTFHNYHYFDHRSFVYVTEDFGQTWQKISNALPEMPCRVIKEGLKNPNLLFLGTEFGLYISLDKGITWYPYENWNIQALIFDYSYDRTRIIPQVGNFPKVAIHDLQIHPREDELIIGSHGRGIWIIPIRPLEEMGNEAKEQDVYFTSPGTVYLFPTSYKKSGGKITRQTSGNTQPGTLLSYYLKKETIEPVTIRFEDTTGQPLILEKYRNEPDKIKAIKNSVLVCSGRAGLNSVQWINYDKVINMPGDYRVVLTVGKRKYVHKLHVEDATDEILSIINQGEKKTMNFWVVTYEEIKVEPLKHRKPVTVTIE